MEKMKPTRKPLRRRNEGIWALCGEAQADGVPCVEMGRKCEVCEKAVLEQDYVPSGRDNPGQLTRPPRER